MMDTETRSFGGKDFYELLAELNGKESDRSFRN